MIKLTTCIILLLSTFQASLVAQTIDSWISKNEKLPVEKIYLHTNQDFYFTGETIWFKSYLTDSRSGRLIPGAENLYVNLVDEQGKRILQTVLMSVNGQAPGNIQLPDTLKPGNYMIEAFTDYLLNFNQDAFFYKPVQISRTTTSGRFNENQQRFSRTQRMVADVSFLPEGGKLLANTSNVVAFKAINRDGYGVEAKGSVRDEKGNTVIEFSTNYRGMGLFFFQPQEGKKYTARINGFPTFNYDFDSVIVNEGVKLQLVNHTSNELIINVAGNSDRFNNQVFYLVNMHRGEVVFYQAFENEKQNHVLKFNSENLKGGINRLVLLDSKLKPVSERLIFSDNYQLNKIKASTDSMLYRKRSPVNLTLSDMPDLPGKEFSNLSVSVLHEDAIHPSGKPMNILSSFLINSELTGFIESSTDYFSDAQMNSKTKIRLLMLTHGWRGYFWNTVPPATDTLRFKQKAGIDIRGIATNVVNELPVEEGEITMILEKDGEMAFLTQKTNQKGGFVFPGLLFNDTAKVYVQAKNEKGRMNTDISLTPVFPEPPPSKNHVAGLNSFYNTPYELQRQKYYSDLEQRKYDPNYRSRNIAQVDIIESRPLDDGHFRMYSRPDDVIEIGENESSYGNVLEFMTGRVAGVDINGDEVRIRGTSGMGNTSTPLFLLDGVPLLPAMNTNIGQHSQTQFGQQANESQQSQQANTNNMDEVVDMVKSVPLGDIDKVEILKSPDNLALFGTEGANGVIAIYTKRGQAPTENPVLKG
ncbi:MAG TPA: hypothetical protein VKA10_06600, partial [Prolixibacteraceae bacterium]|nr:hypothetical protein [Prolixibacteraceae bacterium]